MPFTLTCSISQHKLVKRLQVSRFHDNQTYPVPRSVLFWTEISDVFPGVCWSRSPRMGVHTQHTCTRQPLSYCFPCMPCLHPTPCCYVPDCVKGVFAQPSPGWETPATVHFVLRACSCAAVIGASSMIILMI